MKMLIFLFMNGYINDTKSIMTNNLKQLTLGLNLKDDYTFKNFYPGNNGEILVSLQKAAIGEGEKIIYLCALEGQGLSHLLQASCRFAHEHRLRCVYLPMKDLISLSPVLLQGMENIALICMDDIHLAAGLPHWEEAIFHLYNRTIDKGGRLIFSSRDVAKSLPFKLPDLASRLAWGMVYQLQALKDNEKLQVLKQRADFRGMTLTEEAGKYLLHRCSRQMGALFSTLDILDKASLSAKRRLTIPFIKEVLKI